MKFGYLISLALLVVAVHAQQECTGVISSPPLITSDVKVPPGATCTLSGVNVTGSVQVSPNAAFATTGKVRVFGSVSGTNCASLVLAGKLAVSGGVTSTGCKLIDVGKNANVGSLMTTNVGSVVLQGTVALLSIGGNTDLVINGGRVLGGGISRQNAKGSTSICGSVVLGGIKLQNVDGGLSAKATATCTKSDISGTIELTNTKGDVKIGGGMLLGADFIATMVDGNVELSNTHLSDVSINDVSGTLGLMNIIADSDATVSNVDQSITVTGSSFDGDFSITRNIGTVNIVKNDFTLEDILITNNNKVSIRNNGNFSFAANENGNIEVLNNQAITTASINKNTGVTTITSNTFETLSCTDNNQVVGSQNNVMMSTGQCSNL